MPKIGVEAIVCNGDMIQGGPQPAETMQRLRDLYTHSTRPFADEAVGQYVAYD